MNINLIFCASGIGVHYEQSALVTTTHQDLASKLTIGERLIPQVVIRAADARPENIQDLVPADMRYKILLFPGDISDHVQRTRLETLANLLSAPNSFLLRFTPTDAKADAVFDILTIW